MPRAKSKPTSAIGEFEAEWIAFREKERNAVQPPCGAITSYAYGRLHGMSDGAAFRELSLMHHHGKLESGMFLASSPRDGKMRQTRHWWKPAKK